MTDHQWQQAFDAGRAEAEGLVEAVLFYAEPANWQTDWQENNSAMKDMGNRARTALAKYREGK